MSCSDDCPVCERAGSIIFWTGKSLGSPDGAHIVTFHPCGKVEFNPRYSLDKLAAAFVECVQSCIAGKAIMSGDYKTGCGGKNGPNGELGGLGSSFTLKGGA